MIFNLLHASDLHIGATPQLVGFREFRKRMFETPLAQVSRNSSHDPQQLDALAALAYRSKDTLDAVVLSGDLATNGDTVHLNAAAKFVREKATTQWWSGSERAASPTLQGCGLPVYLIPGNHDRFTEPRFAPGGKTFDKVFSRSWPVAQSVHQFAPVKKDGAELVIIGADCSLRKKRDAQGRWGYLGQGHVYSDLTKNLEALTEGIRDANRGTGVVWVVHFPPEPPREAVGADADLLQLLKGGGLLKAAENSGVTILFCGHIHKPFEYVGGDSPHSIDVFVAGTATEWGSPTGNHVQILTIDVDASGETTGVCTVLSWDHERHEFLSTSAP